MLWMPWLPLVAKDGVEDEAKGGEEEGMVKKVKPALSGCLPNNDVCWRRRGQQGHLQPERPLANNHVS